MKGSNGASIGPFTKLVLREHGVDPRSVGFCAGSRWSDPSRVFAGGMGDYLVIDYLCARVEAAGKAASLQPLAIMGGNVPWSVYYAEGDSDDERLDKQTRFVRALGRGMTWIQEHEAENYREFLAKTFPRFDPSLLVGLTDTYRAHGMWTTPRIDPAAYERWRKGIADGHLTDSPIGYRDLIDTRPTDLALGS